MLFLNLRVNLLSLFKCGRLDNSKFC